jgi:hypothetical protein
VKPEPRETGDDGNADRALLGTYLELRRLGKTVEEAVALLEPDPDKQESLTRRLQRLQRFYDQPIFRGDN